MSVRLQQALEDRSRAPESRVKFSDQGARVLGASLAPDLLETQRQVGNLVRTDRAGDAFDGVRRALQASGISRFDGAIELVDARGGLVEEAGEDAPHDVGRTGALQLAQLEE